VILSDKKIADFQAIYKARFGKEISREVAIEKGIKLLRLIEIIYKPMTKKEYQQLQERRKQTGDL
jgi:hypothetical protein